jgi:cell division protein FtsW (lipid II flippase)
MKKAKKPLLVNLAIATFLVLTDAALSTSTGGDGFPLPRLMVSGLFILVLAFINLLIAMVRNRNRTCDGQYYLLCCGLLLLIGFSVCSVS